MHRSARRRGDLTAHARLRTGVRSSARKRSADGESETAVGEHRHSNDAAICQTRSMAADELTGQSSPSSSRSYRTTATTCGNSFGMSYRNACRIHAAVSPALCRDGGAVCRP